MRKKRDELVNGIGVNDADYQIVKHAEVDGKRQIVWRCPIYLTWSLMIMRCYNAGYQDKYPTYKGCEVYKKWLTFSSFARWMKKQPWENNCLDKDILCQGNKLYSPAKCVFIPNIVNTFVTDSAASRGAYPIGVSIEHKAPVNKYKAACRNPLTKKKEYLGCYPCPNEAHNAWRKRKHELACELASQQTDKRVARALRKRFKGD